LLLLPILSAKWGRHGGLPLQSNGNLLTPDLPPYGSFRINQSYQGNILGAKVADPSGQMLIVFSPGQAPRNIHKSKNLFFGPSLS